MFGLIENCSMRLRMIAALAAVLCVSGCGGTPQQRAQSYYEQGTKHLSQKEYVKAGIEFKNALQLNNSLVKAWRGLAQVEEQNQNLRALPAIYRKIVELDQKDSDARLKLAKTVLVNNNVDEALKLINAALALNERNTEALVLKAGALLKSNDAEGAIREAEKVLEIEPNNTGALIVLAAEKASRADNQGALDTLGRAGAAEGDLGIQLFKIHLFERMSNLEQVENLMKRVVELWPKEPAFRRQLAKLYVNKNRMDEAERELRAIAAMDPNNIEYALEVVRFLNTTRGADAAKQELLVKIKAGEKAFSYQIALAEFEAAQGNTAESVRILESLIKDKSTPENVLTAQAKLAELRFAMKDLAAANALAAEILSKDSRNIGGLKIRAMVRMEQGQLNPAIVDLRQALNDQARAVDLMLLLALAYERNGTIDLADKQYAEATRASNFSPNVGLNYTAFLQRRGGVARAEDVLTELATRWPTNVQVLSALANVKLTRGDYIGAEEIATSLRKTGKQNEGLANQILGEALMGRKKFDQSIEVLQNVHDLAPLSVQPVASLVKAFVRANQIERALAFLDEVLKKNPNNADVLVLRGSTQLLNKDPQAATKSFKMAIEKQPKSTIGYHALSDMLFQERKYRESLGVLQDGLKEVPGNFTLRLLAAGIYERLRDFDTAIAEYEALLRDQPGSMVVANNLASLLTDYREDKASFDRAYALIPNLQKTEVAFFKDTIGWVYYRRGEYKAALTQLEQASVELPNVAMVRYHLGATYIAAGQIDKGANELKKALDLAANDNTLQETVRNVMKRAGIH